MLLWRAFQATKGDIELENYAGKRAHARNHQAGHNNHGAPARVASDPSRHLTINFARWHAAERQALAGGGFSPNCREFLSNGSALSWRWYEDQGFVPAKPDDRGKSGDRPNFPARLQSGAPAQDLARHASYGCGRNGSG